ncbi:Zn-ribbon domain-containing OB-fold protein [Acidianus manzaensis]|uniref:DNA-binding protein n=1 Tax=Acidianus manzaensis TaxID=282676 RepID=A0A1W6JWL6_9CREN|nr:Zn-ribbon domain-containing OB-fold protein [Acidianus manzaensis]ARM74658.1 DNA-binding protein [Acidianus manzaensis]
MEGIPLFMKYELPDVYKEFWDGLKKGEILGTKCKKCGKIYFPPQKDCTNCMTTDLEWVKLSKEGTIMTYSIVKQKPQGFENFQDYIIAIVRNSDDVDLMCWLLDKNPRVNEKVKLTSDGKRILCEGEQK